MLTNAYGARAGDRPLEPIQITRREPGPHDVRIDIAYCGICHSDLHQVRGEWAGTRYPCVPGHEIVGRVSAVGDRVTGLRRGDLVGVGYFYPFADIETISPRPMLFITGDQAHSKEFSEEAYRLADQPKELYWVKGAGHVDLYDRVDLIPFDKLSDFFKQNLAAK